MGRTRKAKKPKTAFDRGGARKKWGEHLAASGVALTGPQLTAAEEIVVAIDESSEVTFWEGQATGKSFLLEQIAACFG